MTGEKVARVSLAAAVLLINNTSLAPLADAVAPYASPPPPAGCRRVPRPAPAMACLHPRLPRRAFGGLLWPRSGTSSPSMARATEMARERTRALAPLRTDCRTIHRSSANVFGRRRRFRRLQGSTAGQERQGVRRVLGYGGYYDYGYYCSKRVERQVGEQGRLVPPQASA